MENHLFIEIFFGMGLPLHEQAISFKTALAVAAVQRRRHNIEVEQLEQRCKALEQMLEATKQKEQQKSDNIMSLIAAGSDFSEASGVASLEVQLACMESWRAAAQLTPLEMHPFLAKLLQHSSHRRSKEQSIGILCTPTQACIEVLEAVMTDASASENQAAQHAEIILSTTNCLVALCSRPAEVISDEDFSRLQSFTGSLLESICRCGERSEIAVARCKNASEAMGQIFSALKAGPMTGYIVLGCAAHSLHAVVSSLAARVTGETSPRQGGALEEQEEEWGGVSDAALSNSCVASAQLLQDCLRGSPVAMTAMPPDETFMRGVAEAMWATSEVCNVIALAHSEVAKQGQRCAALLVSALQQVCHQDDQSLTDKK